MCIPSQWQQLKWRGPWKLNKSAWTRKLNSMYYGKEVQDIADLHCCLFQSSTRLRGCARSLQPEQKCCWSVWVRLVWNRAHHPCSSELRRVYSVRPPADRSSFSAPPRGHQRSPETRARFFPLSLMRRPRGPIRIHFSHIHPKTILRLKRTRWSSPKAHGSLSPLRSARSLENHSPLVQWVLQHSGKELWSAWVSFDPVLDISQNQAGLADAHPLRNSPALATCKAHNLYLPLHLEKHTTRKELAR